MPNTVAVHKAVFGPIVIHYFVRKGEPYTRELVRLKGDSFVEALDAKAIVWLEHEGGVQPFVKLSWFGARYAEPVAAYFDEIRRRLLVIHAETNRSASGEATVEFPKFSPAP